VKPLNIDHIGVAVQSIDEVASAWEALGLVCEHRETVPEQRVLTAMYPVGESRIELLEPTSPESPIAKFLDKKGSGIHHVAFRVADLATALVHLQTHGFALIDSQPRHGADGKLIAFLHPKSTGGVLIELCQEG
jgi:methylmalonyl-CoA/ethylmalonyl-CoA epimerase